MEATQNVCCVKGESTVAHSTVTRWFKKFCSSYKNLDNETRSGKPKNVDSKAMFLAMKANSMSSTQNPVWFVTSMT